jgi:hypothetical protein
MSNKIFGNFKIKLTCKGSKSSSVSASDVSHDSPDSSKGAHGLEPGADARLKDCILAFRTITTLLATIPEGGVINLTTNQKSEGHEKTTLRVLAALATILVRQHEVVTVAALPNGLENSLQVAACAQLDSADGSEQQEPSRMVSENVEQSQSNQWELYTTRNYRRDERDKSFGGVFAKYLGHVGLGGGDSKLRGLETYLQPDAYVQFSNLKFGAFFAYTTPR